MDQTVQPSGLIPPIFRVTRFSVGFSLMGTIVYVLCSFYMLYQKNNSFAIESKLNAPLNTDTVSYNAVLSTRIGAFTKYSTWLFLVLPWFTIGILGIKLFMSFRSEQYPMVDFLKQYRFLIIVVLANLIAWSIFTPLFFELRKNSKVVDARIKSFDNFICSKLTRETSINELLSKKAEPEERNRLIKDIIANKLPNDTEGDAKVFYTIHLYQYFHKLGTNHVQLPAALSLFKNSSRLSKCTPSKYFTRYSPNIQDLTEKIRNILRENDNLDNSTRDALELCKKWVRQTMFMANNLTSENVTNQFSKIINTNAVVLPFIVIAAYLAQFVILTVKKNSIKSI